MSGFFTVRTFHGSTLLVNEKTGYIEAGEGSIPGMVRVYAYLRDLDGSIAYLGASLPEQTILRLHPQEGFGRLVPVGKTRRGGDGSVAFYSPWNQLFLVVAPHEPPTRTGHAVLVTVHPRSYEKLYLDPADLSEVPLFFREMVQILDAISDPIPTALSVSRELRKIVPTKNTRDVINAVGLLLSRYELQTFGQTVASDQELIARMMALFPDDLSAKFALGPLSKWIEMRKGSSPMDAVEPAPAPARTIWSRFSFRRSQDKTAKAKRLDVQSNPNSIPQEIGTEFDRLDSEGITGSYVSLAHAATMSIRQSIKAYRRTCILATARNEGLYLLDWLAHHRAMGFEAFFIYSNGNIDGSDDLLRGLAEAGEITWINNIVGNGTRPQWKAYNHALQIMPEILDFEWTLVIDLDEYFSLNSQYFFTVNEYLDWAERREVDAIGFNWFVIGSNGETHWRDAPLRKRFPTRMTNPDAGGYASLLIKSMFRTRRFPVSMPHHPVEFWNQTWVFRNSSMQPYAYDPLKGQGESLTTDCHLAWIDHYFFKSNEEFVYKFSRARGDDRAEAEVTFSALTSGFVESFISSSDPLPNDSKNERLDALTEAWKQSYLGRPSIKQAYASILKFYSGRLRELLPALSHSPAILKAGEAGQRFISPLLR